MSNDEEEKRLEGSPRADRKAMKISATLEPAASLSPRTIIIITVVGFIAIGDIVGSITNLATLDKPVGQRVWDLSLGLISVAALFLCWFVWKLGGFRQLGSLRISSVLLHIMELAVVGVHYLGSAIEIAGYLAVSFTVLLAVIGSEPQTTRIAAEIAAVSVFVGTLIKKSTRGRRVTLDWRIERLRRTLKTVGQNAEKARKGLLGANLALAEIETELTHKNTALNSQRVSNQEMTSALKGDPAAVAAYEDARRRESRRSLRHQWLGVVCGVVFGVLTTAFFGSDPGMIGRWLTTVIERLQSM